MKIIELSIASVEIVDVLTWGMQEEVRASMLGGVKMKGLDKDQDIELNPEVLGQAKYKALELCVKKITLKDGSVISYSKDWMNALSIEDGDKLYEAVNEITIPKKK